MVENVSSATQGFASFANGGVDPRTGLYSFSLNIPVAPANALAGPAFDLVLSFNPLGGDDWGYGQGWAPSLSRLQRTAPRTLALSTGERFATGAQNGEPQVFQRKLESFRLFRDSPNAGRVVHRSGQVEHLSYPGYGDYLVPVVIEGPDGRWIKLIYDNDQSRARLKCIEDEAGNELLRIQKSGSNLLLYPASSEDDFVYTMTFQSGRLQSLSLPESIGGQWSFGYYANDHYPTINQVIQPLGAVEQLAYTEVHKVPGGRPDLPRVTEYRLMPLGGADTVVQTFGYSSGEKNFLGYNEVSIWPEDGSDPLYAVRSDYEYGSTVTQADGGTARSIERVYNRFHLQLREATTQGHCRFTRTTHYGDLRAKTFDEQAHTFQLPLGVTSAWYDTYTHEAREENTEASYDVHGNVVRQVDASGIETRITYYAAAGEEGCPADPWGFVRHMKRSTRLPAPTAAEQGIEGGGLVQVTEFRYTALPLPALAKAGLTRQVPGARAASHYLLVARETTLVLAKAEDTAALASQTVAYDYYQDIRESLSFGRLKTRTADYGGHSSTQTHVYEALGGEAAHGMRLAGQAAPAARLRTTITHANSDNTGATSTVEQSLRTGQTLSSVDAVGVDTASRYDGLGRLLSLAVAPGSDISAERTFSYTGHVPGSLAEQRETNAAGVTRRAQVDGLGRTVARYLDSGWRAAPASPLTWEGRYNVFGQLVAETGYDDCGEGGAVVGLVTTHAYDDWGQLRASTGPDGVCQVNQTHPLGTTGPVTRRFRQYTDADGNEHHDGVRETRYNRQGLPWETTFTDADGTLAERVRYTYDGFGALLRAEQLYSTWADTGTSQQSRTTAYQYDAWGRLVLTTLPNGDLVGQGYAAHSPQALLATLSYGRRADTLTALANRDFDQLARVTRLSQGGRTAQWAYHGASPAPCQATLADGSTLGYTYQPALTASPLTVTSASQGVDFTYHPVTGQLQQATPQTSAHAGKATADAIDCQYHYNPLGQLTQEQRQGGTFTTAYSHSVQGRRLSRDDGAGAVHWRYDANGRPRQATSGQAVTTFGYDPLGNVTEWACAGVKTTVTLDSFGREAQRRLASEAGDETLQRYVLQWHGDGTLAGRDTYAGSGSEPVLKERFHYDQRNRLSRHDCSGDAGWLPRDRFGNAYTRQVFLLDALDNVTRVVTTQADKASCTSVFSYASDDPCQLASAEHTRGGKVFFSETFTYDTLGRMTQRTAGSQGTTLEYDSLGRLNALTDARGRNEYLYDPHGSLCAVVHGGQRQERFYDGYAIDHLRSGDAVQRYLRSAGTPLAWVNAEGQATALLADSAGSVTGEWRQTLLSRAVYSAYGDHHGVEGEAEQALGYNGELREAEHGGYLLGRGYRLYDPGLMCFNQPDSDSPFGAGGLNPYRYAQGNPIMLHDPSGHAPMPVWDASTLPYYVEPEKQEQSGGWLGKLFSIVGWGFVAWEAWSLVQIVVGVVTAPVGGAMLAMAGAAALTAASLGTGIASMIDPDNSALMYAGIGLGITSGLATSKAMGMVARAGGAGKNAAPRLTSSAAGDDWQFLPKSQLPRINVYSDLGSPYGERFTVNPIFDAGLPRRNSAPGRLGQQSSRSRTVSSSSSSSIDSAEWADLNRRAEAIINPRRVEESVTPAGSMSSRRSSINSISTDSSSSSANTVIETQQGSASAPKPGFSSPYIDAARRANSNLAGGGPVHSARAIT